MNVTQLKNKNQFVITHKGARYFQSYSSTCAKIDANGVLSFGFDWDYSKTTLKHLYIFLSEYKNDIENFQYSQIFKGFYSSKNKRAYLQKLINNDVIKVANIQKENYIYNAYIDILLFENTN